MPELLEDMVFAHNSLSASVTSFTFGYFIYDFFDLLAASRWSISKTNFDIILHHVLVICCFGSCVVQQRYMGLSMLSILMEVNSVFLHLRKISRNFDIKSGLIYYSIVALNFITLLAFRVAVSYKMIVWLSTVDRSGIPNVVFYLGVIAMPIIAAMNCVLFYRCLRVDILRPLSRPIKKE
ncbi:Oidioi.mRNA.OKI2018_I69.chr2.g8326.t1.cds [Oikopleura dioica]|uniref:Oidioi.mRNA.OKI2018_I69.chr2.g8326.t1.cds n=1 Tax=Oikopleura dioica TaxID=34765 RepID=A0ABN7T9V1_OIKDI|nr:Oidioi.mRNA.OKI2018_I69.chr2.g8326.t1.cds [Oikopleura dioica]